MLHKRAWQRPLGFDEGEVRGSRGAQTSEAHRRANVQAMEHGLVSKDEHQRVWLRSLELTLAVFRFGAIVN